MNYRYHLLKYAGPASRLTCPACGRKHCFSPYVDSNNQIIGEEYGRCNHESSCGYVKYPPSEREWRQSWSEYQSRRKPPQKRVITCPQPKPKPEGSICTIPMDIVLKTVRTNPLSDFLHFLCKIFDVETIMRLIEEYAIGVTRSGDTVFYQIDMQGRCRTGKVMKYDRETGHRIKDSNVPGAITWVHTLLKKQGVLPPGVDADTMPVRMLSAQEIPRQACVLGRGREDGHHLCWHDAPIRMGGHGRQDPAWRQGGSPRR